MAQRVDRQFASRAVLATLLAGSALAGAVLGAIPALAQTAAPGAAPTPSLETSFRDPPNSARPRVWWHWMNGNITKDGIAKDMAWMKRVGIGGMQNFDADLSTPQIVEHRLVYMTPGWKDAFHFAASEADRLGLELAIAASPGWSETGGPWVKPEDGLKKIVWSSTSVSGGQHFAGHLPSPPHVTGPFLDLPYVDALAGMSENAPAPAASPQSYGDIAVFAVRDTGGVAAQPVYLGADGKPVDGAVLTDNNLATGLVMPRGTAASPSSVTLHYPAATTIRSAQLFLSGAKAMFSGPTVAPRLEASDDGQSWRKVADIAVAPVPTTISFAPVTAAWFRVVLAPAPPSGANLGDPAPGTAPPEFVMAMMARAAKPVQVNALTLSPAASVDRAESKAGFDVEQDYYALGQADANAPALDPAQVINLTSKMRPDGSLDWVAPPGNWRILRIGSSLLGTTNHPAPAEATGLEVDKFDGDAVRRYLDHYLGMYRDAAGSGMIGAHGVRALLTDSIEVGAANWTPKMIAQFTRLRGYDPTPWLPVLTGVLIGSREQSDKFLYDYRRTLADLISSEHYGVVAEVAHANGLKVYGEALEDHRPSLGDDMAMRSHADVPMSALWTFSRKAGPNPGYLADMKGAASVAHIYGQNLVAAESMTSAVAPWVFAPNNLRRIIDLEFATGVNRPVVHTSVHQPVDDKKPGLSLMIFGQYFTRHETWAEMAKAWVDYIARNALMLQQGRNIADVAYFYGEEGPLTGLYGDHPVADAPTTHAYDFINADALMTAIHNEGNELVAKGGARYKALYLGGSSARMTLKMLTRIAALVEGGATLVGQAPTGSPGLGDDAAAYQALVQKLWPGAATAQVGTGRVIASQNIEQALQSIGVAADFRTAGVPAENPILFLHRQFAGGDSYYVDNRGEAPVAFDAHFRITGKVPELWHADTGKAEPVSYRSDNGETIVPMRLDGDESVHVVFRKTSVRPAATVAVPVVATLGQIAGPWTVAFPAGCGAPPSVNLPALAPLNEQSDPGVRYFSGVASYVHGFTAPRRAPGKPLWLNLGQVHELAEVLVNGKSIGIVWHAPYRIDISTAVRPGANQLEVRVANLWVNRLIGDAQPGATKIAWTASPQYVASAPLRPSGLIGPVTLETQ